VALVVAAGSDRGLTMQMLESQPCPRGAQGARVIYLRHCEKVGLGKVPVEEVDWRWFY
jgi:hypothetical protein